MYLAKRGGVYYFRRPVPLELQPFVRTAKGAPRTEFMESLRTKELASAKRLLGPAIVASQRALDDAEHTRRRQTSALRPAPITPQEEYEEAHRLLSWNESFEDHARWESREAARESVRDVFRRPVDELTEAELAVRDLIADGELDAQDMKDERARKVELEWDAAAREVSQSFSGRQQVVSHPSIKEAFTGYVAERRPAPATVKRWRPIVENLAQFLGHDDASKVSRKDIIAWKNSLRDEVLPNGKQRSARTINETYLPAARVTFEWALRNADSEFGNPVENVSILVPETILSREDRGFTDAEARTILRASLAIEQNGTLAARSRRWLPWLCAYTGARVNEITPLLAEEVEQLEGVWVMNIRPGTSDTLTGHVPSMTKRSVKTRKARYVPLHPHLIQMGFLDLIRSVGSGPVFYDPSKARKPNPANPQHKKVAERLGAWVRGLGVVDEQIGPNHAWRHLFATNSREAGINEAVINAITGHAQSTEGAKYGRFKPSALLRELETLPPFNV
jgi:integrase